MTNFNIRFSASNLEVVKAGLSALGKDGESALNRINRASANAESQGLQALNAGLVDIQGEIAGTLDRLGPLGSGLRQLGPAGIAAGVGVAAVTTALVAGASAVVTNAREYETLRARLLSTTGSAALAAAAFERVEGFARRTPFEITNLVEAFIQLKAAGVDPSIERLTAFGDTAAGFGRDITDFARAVVGALTGEGEALKAFGIIARFEGDSVRFNFRGTSREVTRDAESIVAALEEIGRTAFAGGMAEQAKTLEGASSNLQDAWAGLLDTIDRTAGVAEGARGGLRTLTELVNQAEVAIERLDSGSRISLVERLNELREELNQLGDDAAARGREIERLSPTAIDLGFGRRMAREDIGELEAEEQRAQAIRSEIAGITLELEKQERIRYQTSLLEAEQLRLAKEAADQAKADAAAAEAEEEAEKEAAKLATRRAADRARALKEIERLEEKAAVAGLEGVERLEVMRDQAVADQRARLDAQLIDEQEFARARIAIEESFQAEKDQIEKDAADRRQKEADRIAKKALDDARREAERQAEAQARPFINAAENIQDGFSDAFFEIFRNGKLEGEDFLDFFKDAYARMLAELATLAIAKPIIVPAVAAVAGGLGLGSDAVGQITQNLGGGGFSLGGGGFGGFGGGFGNLFQVFGANGDFSISSGLNALGASLGFAQTFPAGTASALGVAPVAGGLGNAPTTIPGIFGSTTFSSFLGGAGLGFGAGTLLNGLFGGNPTGGTIGSGVGSVAGAAIGSIIPGVGTILGGLLGGGAGGLLGGLFGEDKDYPFALARLGFNSTSGEFEVFSRSQLDGGDAAPFEKALENLGDRVEAFAAAIGATIEGSSGVTFGSGSGRSLGSGFFVGNNSVSLGQGGRGLFGKNIGSSENAAELALQRLLQGTQFGGLDPEVEAVLRTSLRIRGDLEETVKDVELARAIFEGAFGFETEEVIQAKVAIEEINTAFDDMTERAKELGLSVAELDQGRENALTELTEGFDEGIRLSILGFTDPFAAALERFEAQAEQRLKEAEALGADLVEVEKLTALERAALIEQFAQQSGASLKAFMDELTFGDLSGVTAAQSVSGARAAFEAAAAQATAGDPTARGNIEALARSLLDVSRTAFASSAGFQSDLARVREVVEALLLDVPGFASGTLSAPSGFGIVNHGGLELIRFGGGEQVFTAAQTRQIFSAANAGGGDRGMMAEVGREISRGNAEIVAELTRLRKEVEGLRQDNDQLRRDLNRRDRVA